MGNGYSPIGFFFATICVEIEDLYLWVRVVLEAHEHGQSLKQRSLMFWLAVVLFSLKVLLTVRVDSGKGSVAISSHLT